MDAGTPQLGQVVIDSLDARASAEFWRQLLGLVYRKGHEPPAPGEEDTAGRDWLNLERPDGSPCLAIERVEDLARSTWPDARVPQQLHLDLIVHSLEDLLVADERVARLGGQMLEDRIDDGQEPLRVYADPDGHPFCIFVVFPAG